MTASAPAFCREPGKIDRAIETVMRGAGFEHDEARRPVSDFTIADCEIHGYRAAEARRAPDRRSVMTPTTDATSSSLIPK